MGKWKDLIYKVLIIDYKTLDILAITNMLKVFDVIIDKAYTGKQAIRKVRSEEYDLILVEHSLQDMNGVQTIKLIRENCHSNKKKTIIYAISDEITEELKRKYKEVGADGIFEAPLEANKIIKILQKHFKKQISEAIFKEISMAEVVSSDTKDLLLTETKGINHELGLKITGGDKNKYREYLLDANDALNNSIIWLLNDRFDIDLELLQLEISNLRKLFFNIGELELMRSSIVLEKLLKHGDVTFFYNYLIEFIDQIKKFKMNLELELLKFEIEKPDIDNSKSSKSYIMSEEEYELCLLNTIYYIKISDYDSIINELINLIHLGKPDFKEELKKAFEDVLEFDYKKAMKRLVNINTIINLNHSDKDE